MTDTANNTDPKNNTILFPMKHRKGKIRHVAAIFAKKRGKDREAYWRRTVENMRKQAVSAGIAPEVVELHVSEFSAAVALEATSYEPNRKDSQKV
ncbi:hypothetical protein PsAD46_05414 [Pseudovibrio sp. Ad46]|uniref:DUF6074 family protein n=1 Tax=Pseudovibrio sp. Ad46 TaxID=989432 RepID=UPI0007AE6E57|nr:DUF6074 family protein [Pseudovibrio sp. Ad46]KZK76157.1 hypothetical protein PsAD46_05414 [Pseudovibrio sp. Ad46]